MKKGGVPAVFLCKRSFQCVFLNPAIKSRRQRAGRLISVIYVLFLRLKGVKNKRPEVCENHTLGPFCMHEISQAPLPQAIMCIHERPSFT